MSSRRTPDRDQLRRLVVAGLTDDEIADWTLENMGNRVGRSGIAKARARAGIDAAYPRARYLREIPWELPDALQHHPDVRRLRLWARVNHGEPISPDEQAMLAKFQRDLDAADQSVAYDHTACAISRAPRRAGETYVRQPDVP